MALGFAGVLNARDICDNGKVGGPPVYIMCPHNTKGDSVNQGPSYTSNYSSKAITERLGSAYGGSRAYEDPTAPSQELRCCIDNPVDISCTEVSTTRPAIPSQDFDFKQHCCTSGTPRTPLLGDVVSLGGTPPGWKFTIQKNDTPGNNPNCGCPPTDYRQACDGAVALEMTSSHLVPNWEPPEFFGIAFQSAQAAAGSTGEHVNFGIGDISNGLVWVIQDACESRTLFEYELPADSDGPGTPCIQMGTEFESVGGQATAAFCNPAYYHTTPSGNGPITIAGAAMDNYVKQNLPGAASEVVVEGSHFDLLLGYIDRNARTGFSIDGDFYEGMQAGDRVQIQLIIKNQSNWPGNMPPECANSTPPPPGAGEYNYYAVPGPTADYELAERVPNDLTTCQNGDFHWETLTPYLSGSNWIYTVFFDESEVFYEKIRGLRLTARSDSVAEGPEIVHIELLSAMYLPSGDAPAVPVDLGWSSAFRMAIVDQP